MPIRFNPLPYQFDVVGTGTGPGSGDVTGPASAVDNNFAAFDGTTGKLIKDSGFDATDFLQVANNLSDVPNDALARTNIGAGDVNGPASAVSGNLASYNGVTGKIIQDSGISAANIPTSGAVIADEAIVRGDGGGKGIQGSLPHINDTGQVLGIDGTNAAPSYSFLNETGTGMYLNGAQNLGFTVLGTLRENINETRRRIIGIGDALTITTNAGDIVASAFDVILGVTDTSAPRSVTLPNSSLVGGQYFIIKDMSGGAGTNNITVSVTGGTKTIDGQTSQLIDVNWGAMTVFYDGSNYFIT